MESSSSSASIKRPRVLESKESKLQRRRERARRASETAAEKEQRLKKRRERDRAAREAESEEHKEARLQRKRTRRSERLP